MHRFGNGWRETFFKQQRREQGKQKQQKQKLQNPNKTEQPQQLEQERPKQHEQEQPEQQGQGQLRQHEQNGQQKQQQRGRAHLRHTQMDPEEVNVTDLCHSADNASTLAGTSLSNCKPKIQNSQENTNHRVKFDTIKRKYDQFKNLKHLYKSRKRYCQVNKTHMEHNYFISDADSVAVNPRWKPQNMRQCVSGSLTQSKSDKVNKSSSLPVCSSGATHTLHSTSINVSDMRTVEVQGKHILKADLTSVSSRFKNKENSNEDHNGLSRPSRTPISCRSHEDSKSIPSFHFGIVDPMWPQYTSMPGGLSPKNLASPKKDCSTFTSYPPLLKCPPQANDFLTSNYLKTVPLLYAEYNSPLRSVLEMNLFGSPTKGVGSTSDDINQYECCHLEHPSSVPLSPWNTSQFLPHSPSLFSVRASLYDAEQLKMSGEVGKHMSMSPHKLRWRPKYPPKKTKLIRPVKETKPNVSINGENKYNKFVHKEQEDKSDKKCKRYCILKCK